MIKEYNSRWLELTVVFGFDLDDGSLYQEDWLVHKKQLRYKRHGIPDTFDTQYLYYPDVHTTSLCRTFLRR